MQHAKINRLVYSSKNTSNSKTISGGYDVKSISLVFIYSLTDTHDNTERVFQSITAQAL